MIERTRRVCREDERLAAAMMYGSFAQGEGDGFSDIEFILFFRDEDLEGLDQEEWVSRISPVGLYFVNEYGNGTAIFENLVRGEFHFDRASEIERVVGESMRDADWLPSLEDTLVLDRTGELVPRLREIVGPPPERDTLGQIRFVCDCFVNWFVFGSNLFARGELARSLDLLGIVRDRLLQMVRVLEGSTLHWFNSSKFLETEISETSYARYVACTASLDRDELQQAYLSAWGWGRELMSSLGESRGLTLPATLLRRLDRRFAEIFSGAGLEGP
ncbi:MAG: lincosamide nucleotidyltransferase Lnu(F) [Rubrobacteraceae bacterium]|nr:lincosamide nucleotidyltransferase Lnu(F) [Rubrobacteraceae bacterium]